MKIQIVQKNNETIEFNDIEYIICEDNDGKQYEIYPKDHSLLISQSKLDNSISQEVKMVTGDDRKNILLKIDTIKELLNKIEDLV